MSLTKNERAAEFAAKGASDASSGVYKPPGMSIVEKIGLSVFVPVVGPLALIPDQSDVDRASYKSGHSDQKERESIRNR